jgi:hypothetical protein
MAMKQLFPTEAKKAKKTYVKKTQKKTLTKGKQIAIVILETFTALS